MPAARAYSSSSELDLKSTFEQCIPAKRELLKKVKALGGKVIGEVKVENTIGGMRYEQPCYNIMLDEREKDHLMLPGFVTHSKDLAARHRSIYLL